VGYSIAVINGLSFLASCKRIGHQPTKADPLCKVADMGSKVELLLVLSKSNLRFLMSPLV
jgi:hypothetical protein